MVISRKEFVPVMLRSSAGTVEAVNFSTTHHDGLSAALRKSLCCTTAMRDAHSCFSSVEPNPILTSLAANRSHVPPTTEG